MSNRKTATDQKIQDLKKRNGKKSSNSANLGPNPFADQVPSKFDSNANSSSNQVGTDIEQLRKENEELKGKNLRLMADMQNVMRQHDMDVAQAKKSAKKEISISFIDFVSTMNLAFSFAPQNPDKQTEAFITSLKSSLEKSLQMLRNYNIEMILPQPDQEFDPEIMTAVNEPNEEGDKPKIKGVVSAGLRVEGQVIKPVMISF